MQAEEAVEIEHVFPWDVDAGPHRVIGTLSVRHHDVQTVGRTALENDDETLGTRGGLGGAEGRASQKTRNGSCANDGQSAIAKKYATCDGHREPQFSVVRSQFPVKRPLATSLLASKEFPSFTGTFACW